MKTVIYGNGSMARVLYSYARHGLEIAGFTVDDCCIADGADKFCDLPLAPFSRVEAHFPPRDHRMIIAVGYVEMNELRERKYQEARGRGYGFVSYLHPSLFIHDGVAIGENCIILDHVSIHPGSTIGRGTFITSNVNIGHDCDIGDNNWINAGVAIAGGCRIGSGCFFGINASVAHGLRMGARNFVAANTLVNRDTLDDQVYLSEPGQLFRLKSQAFLRFRR